MPIYEFFCAECDEAFETLRPSKARVRAPCPACRRAAPRIASVFSARSPGKTEHRERRRTRPPVALPDGAPKPPFALGPPPPLPERYVHQIRRHGHC